MKASTTPTHCPCGKKLDPRGRSKSGLCRTCHARHRSAQTEHARDLYMSALGALPILRELHRETLGDVKAIRERMRDLKKSDADPRLITGMASKVAALRKKSNELLLLIRTIDGIRSLDEKANGLTPSKGDDNG